MYCAIAEPLDVVYVAASRLPDFIGFVRVAGDASTIRIAELLCSAARMVDDRVADVHTAASSVYRGRATVYEFMDTLRNIALGLARTLYGDVAGVHPGETIVTVGIDASPPELVPPASVEATVDAGGERSMVRSPSSGKGVESLRWYLENHFPLLDVRVRVSVSLRGGGRYKTLVASYSATRVASITVVDDVTGDIAIVDECESMKIVCVDDMCYLDVVWGA